MASTRGTSKRRPAARSTRTSNGGSTKVAAEKPKRTARPAPEPQDLFTTLVGELRKKGAETIPHKVRKTGEVTDDEFAIHKGGKSLGWVALYRGHTAIGVRGPNAQRVKITEPKGVTQAVKLFEKRARELKV